MTQISNTNNTYISMDEMQSSKRLPNFFLENDEMKPIAGIGISTLVHIVFVCACMILSIIHGLIFPHLPKPELPNRNIEFKLVQNESKPPINKNTKNRSDRDSQAGGKHDPKKIEAEPRPTAPQTKKSAPSVQQKPQPKKVEQKQVVKPQPQKPVEKPVVQPPKPVQKPAPAKPTVVKPTVKPTVRPVVSPSNVITPSAPKVVSAPKSPFTVSVPPTQAPVGQTYKPQTAPSASKGATGAPSAPAPKFSTSGTSGASSSSSGGSYASRGSNGSYCAAGNPSPGNPNGTPGIDAIRQPDWGPYMRNLEQKIKRNWTPPKGDSSKRVVITFVIGRDGRLLSAKVTKSSGVPLADRAAMSAVELTAPFSPLPPEFRGQSVPIEFTFDYNVINSIMR
ncbi:MAG: TonB family protein [Candidatus Gastranaerophilales bacterium]|nr:TonB family protein [Candidatus Gastranaerophilales bacterium]